MHSFGVVLLCLSLFVLVTSKKKPPGGNKPPETSLKDLIVCKTCIFIEAKKSDNILERTAATAAEKTMDKYFNVGKSLELCIDKPEDTNSTETKKASNKIPMCVAWEGEFYEKKIQLRFGIPIDPNATIKSRGGGKAREINDGDCTGSIDGLGFPGPVNTIAKEFGNMDICLCNSEYNVGLYNVTMDVEVPPVSSSSSVSSSYSQSSYSQSSASQKQP